VTPADSTILRFEDVSLHFDAIKALDHLSFEMRPGQTFVVLGAAGSGKTMLLKVAVGLVRPDSGRVTLFGQEITHLREQQLFDMRARVGILFQEGGLFDSLTVSENVAYPLTNQRVLRQSAASGSNGNGAAARSVEDRVRGSANVPLSPEGTQEATQLGQALAQRGFGKRGDTITPGVLDRARQTGALIAKSAPGARMMPPDKSLDTWRLGAIEGQPTDAVHDQIEQLVKNPDQVPPPGPVSSEPPESFNQFKQRYLPPWKARYANYLKQPNARHVFITHGRGSRLLKGWVAKGMPDDLSVDPSYVLNENDKPGDVHRLAPGPKGKPQVSEVNPAQAGGLKQGLFAVRHASTPWNSPKKQTGKSATAEFKHGGTVLPHGLSPVQMLHA